MALGRVNHLRWETMVKRLRCGLRRKKKRPRVKDGAIGQRDVHLWDRSLTLTLSRALVCTGFSRYTYARKLMLPRARPGNSVDCSTSKLAKRVEFATRMMFLMAFQPAGAVSKRDGSHQQQIRKAPGEFRRRGRQEGKKSSRGTSLISLPGSDPLNIVN